MRWYRIYSCRQPDDGSMDLEWMDQIVQAAGIEAAWAEVKKLGWWPTGVVHSSWDRSTV